MVMRCGSSENGAGVSRGRELLWAFSACRDYHTGSESCGISIFETVSKGSNTFVVSRVTVLCRSFGSGFYNIDPTAFKAFVDDGRRILTILAKAESLGDEEESTFASPESFFSSRAIFMKMAGLAAQPALSAMAKRKRKQARFLCGIRIRG
jgi:hypothetical protein